MIIRVHRPHGRLRNIWLPIPSLALYLAAWAGRIAVRFIRWDRIAEKKGQAMPIRPQKVATALTRIAWILLCSGPYTLCDVRVESQGVSVRITLW
ncbi:MAG: hypothetical protein ABSD48_00885 [Armatimonadota bacterium]